MAKGPGYTVADLVFYTGLIGGIVATYGVLQAMEVEIHDIFKLLIGLGVGVVLGGGALMLYERAKQKPKWPPDDYDPRRDDERGYDDRRLDDRRYDDRRDDERF
jgi:hypothetical protein